MSSSEEPEKHDMSIIFNEFISGKKMNTVAVLAYYITVKRAELLKAEKGWDNMTDADFDFCRSAMKSWCSESACYTEDWESIIDLWKEKGRLPNDNEIAARFGMSKSYFSGLLSRFREQGAEIRKKIERRQCDG